MTGKVLVVDDEDTLRLTIKARLSSAGFEAEDAVDGEDAIEKLKQSQFDIVLLDINMPRMDGITALGVITELRPETDVIMLTGFADFSTAIECLKKGARDYLVKPIDTTELITRMRSLQRARTSEAALLEARRSAAGVLFDDVLNRAIRIHDLLGMVAQGGLGKLTKDQTHVFTALRNLSGAMTEAVQHAIDTKYLAPDALKLTRKPGTLEKPVERAIESTAAVAEARGITVNSSVDAKAPRVNMDATRFEEAMEQMVLGLTELSSKGGAVRISIGKADDQSARLKFETTKVGEKAEKAARQFESSLAALAPGFAKLDHPLVLLHAGKRILEAHGARLSAEAVKGTLLIECTIPQE